MCRILIGISLIIGTWDEFAPFSLKKVENIKALSLIFSNFHYAHGILYIYFSIISRHLIQLQLA